MGNIGMSDCKQHTFVGADNLAIEADVYGDETGRSILFAHGGGQTRHAWRKSAQLLVAAGFQSICIDLRGHGQSDWSPDADYSIESFAGDLLCICDQLEQKPALVGASLGGIAAMIAAGELRPDVFSAVVFVDVTPHMEPAGVEKIVGFMSEHLVEGFASLEDAAEVIASYLPNRPKPKDLSGLKKISR